MGRTSSAGKEQQNPSARPAGGARSRVEGGAVSREALTEVGVLAQLGVVALEALSSPPAVVPTLHDDVHLLVAVLAHVSAEDATPAVAAHWVAAVHRAAPHVPHAVRVHLRPGPGVPQEGVVGGDPVGGFPVHVQPKDFSQESRPVAETQSLGLESRQQKAKIGDLYQQKETQLNYRPGQQEQTDKATRQDARTTKNPCIHAVFKEAGAR